MRLRGGAQAEQHPRRLNFRQRLNYQRNYKEHYKRERK